MSRNAKGKKREKSLKAHDRIRFFNVLHFHLILFFALFIAVRGLRFVCWGRRLRWLFQDLRLRRDIGLIWEDLELARDFRGPVGTAGLGFRWLRGFGRDNGRSAATRLVKHHAAAKCRLDVFDDLNDSEQEATVATSHRWRIDRVQTPTATRVTLLGSAPQRLAIHGL